MNALSSNLVDLLTFLLPGFVAAAIFYSLTPFPRRDSFERTVQALIFTILIQAAIVVAKTTLLFLGSKVLSIGEWTKNSELVWSIALAAGFGLLAATASNRDSIHSALRKLGITHQTSFASEWYGALSRGDSYAVLHLSEGRRLYGWPEEWPSTPGQGHFVMIQAEWLEVDTRMPLPIDTRVLIAATDVHMVELLPSKGRPL